MSEYCDLCEMANCIHTNPPPEQPMPDFVVIGPTIDAQFDGFCEACGGKVRGVEGSADENPGGLPDRITRTDIGWVEVGCVDRAQSPGPPETPANLFEGI